MTIRQFVQRLRTMPTSPANQAPVIHQVAQDYGAICGEMGPWRIAADLGLPQEITDLRYIAYLSAARDIPSEMREACVESALRGFRDWLVRHE